MFAMPEEPEDDDEDMEQVAHGGKCEHCARTGPHRHYIYFINKRHPDLVCCACHRMLLSRLNHQ